MSGWTDERLERLKTLWLQGHSAEQIACDLGGGVTRSAICGKVWRLGLTRAKGAEARPVTVAKRPGTKLAVRKTGTGHVLGYIEASVQPLPPPTPVSAGLNARPWDSRERGECMWPLDGPDGALMACCDKADGKYCKPHHDLAYRPAKQSPRDYIKSMRRYA